MMILFINKNFWHLIIVYERQKYYCIQWMWHTYYILRFILKFRCTWKFNDFHSNLHLVYLNTCLEKCSVTLRQHVRLHLAMHLCQAIWKTTSFDGFSSLPLSAFLICSLAYRNFWLFWTNEIRCGRARILCTTCVTCDSGSRYIGNETLMRARRITLLFQCVSNSIRSLALFSRIFRVRLHFAMQSFHGHKFIIKDNTKKMIFLLISRKNLNWFLT